MSDSTQAESSRESQLVHPEPPGQRRTIRWLMLAALLHGLTYLLLLPPWMGEDEPWHLEYAHYVAAGHMPWGGQEISRADLAESSASQVLVMRELGGMRPEEIHTTQQQIIDSMREHDFWERVDWVSGSGGVENFDQVSAFSTATHQPPLYYLISGKLLALFGEGDILREMWIGRGISLLAYLALVLAAYEVGKRVSADPSIAILCALLVAWWPMHARQAGVVNNDVLAKVASAWTLVAALDIARLGLTWKRWALALLLAACGLAIKTTAAGVIVPLGLAILWRGAKTEAFRSVKVRIGAAAVVVLLLLVVILAYRFSNNPAVPRTLENLEQRLHDSLQPGFSREFARTAVGAFNWYSRNLPVWLYTYVGYGLALGLAGLAFAFSRRGNDFRRGLGALCIAGCSSQLLLVFLRGTAAGRYVMPMLPAFAVLVAVGFLAPFPRRWRVRLSALLALLLLAFDGYFAWAGLTWNQYGVWGS